MSAAYPLSYLSQDLFFEPILSEERHRRRPSPEFNWRYRGEQLSCAIVTFFLASGLLFVLWFGWISLADLTFDWPNEVPPRPWEREHPFAVILLETVTILALVFLALITSGVLVGFFERGNRFSILVLLSYAAFVTSFLLLGRRYLSTFHTSMDDCPSETPITIYITTATIFESNPYAIATAVLFYDQSRVAFTLERVGPEFALVLADLPGFNITFDFFRRTARDSWYGMTAELPASASEQMRIHTPFSHAELVEYDGGGVDGNGVPISLRPPRFILVDQTPGWGARHLVFRTYGPRRHRTLKVCIAQWNAKWRADLRTAFSAFVPLGFTMYHHSQSYEHDWLFKS